MPPRVVESLEELRKLIGHEIGVSDWLAIAQERIQQFADATEDRQWIHVDRDRAERESPYRTTIAHGFLTLSLLSRFMNDVLDVRGIRMGVNYGLNRVRFPAPVRSGLRIRARVTLLSLKDLPDGCEAVFSFMVESEGSDKPSCVAEWVVRFYS
jgi:acyl dehydratase